MNLTLIFIRNAFKYELGMLAKARHPNVVQFIGAVTQKIPMMIVAEYHPKVTITFSMISLSFSFLLVPLKRKGLFTISFIIGW